jgi:hypothetical protein
MRFTSALLADSAQVTAGKLFLIGGAFDTLTTRTLPAVHRSIAVVLVAEIGPADRNRDLSVTIRMVDEDGGETGLQATGKFRVGTPSSLPAGATSSVPLVTMFTNVRFEKGGGYVFVVEHDDAELARIPLRVRALE